MRRLFPQVSDVHFAGRERGSERIRDVTPDTAGADKYRMMGVRKPRMGSVHSHPSTHLGTSGIGPSYHRGESN